MTSLTSLLLALVLFQVPYPRNPGSQARIPVPPSGANTDAVATFNGIFKIVDKKFLTIEVDEGQTMRMYVTGSTKFFRDGKPAKASDFHTDESVTVDASRDARFNLRAVRVEHLSKPAKSPDHPSDPDGKAER
jgi:hypothetical protein